MLRGLLLRESLQDTDVLRLLRITRTESWQVNNATADQPTTWTALSFEADADQADLVSQALSQALKPHGWYVNAATASRVYVIFPNQVFAYRPGDRAQRAAAQQHARSLGIPESQLDWGEPPMKCIRPYLPTDETAVVGVWHRAGRAAYTYLPTWQALTLEQAQAVFREIILPYCELWVGVLDERVVAYLALRGSYVDRLYVDPTEQRQGWGRHLIEHAKALHPYGLELHTHQENYGARALYESQGFIAVKYGLSPAPESAPDVECHWRPGRAAV